ncbi:hypothetical protein ACW7G2_00435 [Luteimonas sp. A277]
MTKSFSGSWKWILSALIVLSMPTACQASLKMWDAKVENRQGVPCFSPAEVPTGDRELLRVALISVSEIHADGSEARIVWMASAGSPDGAALSQGGCLEYGLEPDMATDVEAKALQAGKRYEVFLNTDVGERRDNMRFRAYFCLSGREEDPIVPVQWNEELGSYPWEKCRSGQPASAGRSR